MKAKLYPDRPDLSGKCLTLFVSFFVGGKGEGKPEQQKTVTYWYYFCDTLGKIDWFRTNHRKLVDLMSLQRSILIYLFVTRVNIINIPPCVIGSLADSVGLCQRDGAICKMEEGKL